MINGSTYIFVSSPVGLSIYFICYGHVHTEVEKNAPLLLQHFKYRYFSAQPQVDVIRS
jgi:hypothetical protein